MPPRKIKSPKALEALWEEYKEHCNNQSVLTHDFSARHSEFVSKELRRAITYTVEGFCVYIKLARRAYYDNYVDNERYAHITTRIREECEVDARTKFETGQIPDRLAPLWMSKYGYSAKVDSATEQATIDALDKVLTKVTESMGEDEREPIEVQTSMGSGVSDGVDS